MRDEGPVTLGTAGHVDHGKTTLIEALTGVNTDRLPEEHARGISIALGYASLRTPSERSLSVIDVPGHERFVRTMVSGATGIDLFLMVIAADDGVMPQTLEHAIILDALGLHDGVIAVTKADIADPQAAIEEARTLFPDCQSVACSVHNGTGIDDVLSAIDRVVAKLHSRAARPGNTVLHIDRTFSIRGRGTVVTGTLWSGTLSRGDKLTLLPANTPVRVRGLQIHDEPMETAAAGQRVAANLNGVHYRDIQRGDVLATPGVLHPTRILDCAIEIPKTQANTRVHVHHGTRETPGRLAALSENLWQLRLDHPLLAADGDHVVIRRPSPPDTLGGGVVLDAHARRHGRRADIIDRLRHLRDGNT
ncbi:MAG TPA: selenocysteine-specific translation elongation factor [Solirubrobacteraceae bacterium]|jgi:selenocysteine-specific elongation factor|nr:selenocysteine-specific translation elongation factor [Solirubrobacteraceae bacterium]